MKSDQLLSSRTLRVSYLDREPKYLDRYKAGFEAQLKKISDAQVVNLKSLDELDVEQCDLLVVASTLLDDDQFVVWFESLRSRLKGGKTIWIPVLFFADPGFTATLDLFNAAISENWYFDIVSPDHIQSIPLRVANLIRIHDHLKELERYALALDDIERKVAALDQGKE